MNLMNLMNLFKIKSQSETNESVKETTEKTKEFSDEIKSQSTEQKTGIWLKISKICVFLIVFLLPLWFLPWTTNILDFNKQTLLVFLTFISLLSFLFYSVREKKIKLNFNIFNLVVIGFLIVLGISAVFSSYRYGSFWGWPLNIESSFLTYFCLALFYFLIINLFQKNEILELIFVFIGSVFLAVLFGISQFFGKFILPFNFSETVSFNTVGSTNALGMLSASLLSLMATLIFLSKRLIKILLFLASGAILFLLFLIDFWPAWFVLLIGSVLILIFGISQRESFPSKWLFLPILFLVISLIFGIIKISIPGAPTPQPEILPSYKISFDIAIQTLKDSYLSFFFGSGLGTFIYDYSKFKPAIVNQTSFWADRFSIGGSDILNKLATTGILGLLFFLAILVFFCWLGFKELNKEFKEDQKNAWLLSLGILASWLSIVIGMFLYPTNLVLSLVFWFLTAIFILLISNRVKVFHFNLPSSRMISFSFLFVLILILGVSLLILTGQRYLAELKYLQSLKTFQEGDSQKALNFIVQAIDKTEKKQDLYLRDASQIYLLKINEEVQKQNVSGEEIIQKITLLIRDLLDLTKRAVEIAPKNAANWLSRGLAYRNIIGISSGADEWAEKSYQRAVELEPTNPYIYYELGLIYLTRSDILSRQGKETEKTNNLKLASDNFKKAIDLKADYTPAHFQTGLVFVREGKIQEAINKLELIKQDAPFDATLSYQLGLLYYNTEQFDKAKAEFQKAVGLNKDYSNARYFLGLLYDKEGNKQAAIEQFEQIEKLNPENVDVKKILDNLKKDQPPLTGVTVDQPTLTD